MAELNIAEILFEGGQVQYRYARYLAADGCRWIRHGLFQAFHPNGQVASEGQYVDGLEEGFWQDYYANGQIAAAGHYEAGKEVGGWSYWNEDGQPSG